MEITVAVVPFLLLAVLLSKGILSEKAKELVEATTHEFIMHETFS